MRFDFTLELRDIENRGGVHASIQRVLHSLGAGPWRHGVDPPTLETKEGNAGEEVGSYRIRPSQQSLTRREALGRRAWYSFLLVVCGLVTVAAVDRGLGYFLASLHGDNPGALNPWFWVGACVFAASILGAETAYRQLVLAAEGTFRPRIESPMVRLMVDGCRILSTSGGPAFVGYWVAAVGQTQLAESERLLALGATVVFAAIAILSFAWLAAALERDARTVRARHERRMSPENSSGPAK